MASRLVFKMPWSLCFAQGYTLGAVSPAVLVPSMMILHNAGYGVKKGIPTTLIAASSFDDIIAITVFSVFLTITFDSLEGGATSAVEGEAAGDGAESGGTNIWLNVALNIV